MSFVTIPGKFFNCDRKRLAVTADRFYFYRNHMDKKRYSPLKAFSIYYFLNAKTRRRKVFFRSDSNRIARINMKECPSDRNLTNLHKSNKYVYKWA